MGRKRAHELKTHRLVSSGAGASAVSMNNSRAPTEPAAGISAEQDRLMPAGSPQDHQASREPRRPLRWPRRVSAPCGMWSVRTFDTVAAQQGAFPIYLKLSARLPKRVAANGDGQGCDGKMRGQLALRAVRRARVRGARVPGCHQGVRATSADS